MSMVLDENSNNHPPAFLDSVSRAFIVGNVILLPLVAVESVLLLIVNMFNAFK